MKRFLLVLLLALPMAAVYGQGNKTVIDQSRIITITPAHNDSVWTDNVLTIVAVPAHADTVIPTIQWRETYKVVDTVLDMDSSYNYFQVTYRKKLSSVVPLDTVKIRRMQPRSKILSKTIVMP